MPVDKIQGKIAGWPEYDMANKSLPGKTVRLPVHKCTYFKNN